ncbi:MAG: hypothetical protein RIQ34_1786 [Bacteroidota bacterium]
MRLLASLVLMLLSFFAQAQKVAGKIVFQPGQVLTVNMKSSTTNLVSAMGQELEMKTEVIADHQFKVTNTTDENHTLSHEINRVRFNSDGMGNTMSFDSQSEKDLNGQLGAPVKDLLSKKYNLVIDASGNTLMAMNEGASTGKAGAEAGMLAQFVSGLTELTQAPKQGEASFFKVLPATEVGVGDAWTNTIDRNGTKIEEAYSIAEINENIITLNYLSNSNSTTVQENMGMEVTITMKNKSEGKIKVDRKSGILKEKTITTTATGTVASGYGDFPINSSSTSVITIN